MFARRLVASAQGKSSGLVAVGGRHWLGSLATPPRMPASAAGRTLSRRGETLTSMPLVDLSAQHAAVADKVAESWRDVLPRTTFIGGPQIASFESEYAAFIGVSHCVGVANGTDVTEIALHALPGRDRVLKELHRLVSAPGLITWCRHTSRRRSPALASVRARSPSPSERRVISSPCRCFQRSPRSGRSTWCPL
jgi:hypothetical protein